MGDPAGEDQPTLRCRECARTASAVGPQYCEWCFGPVEVVLPVPVEGPGNLRRLIEQGPQTLARYLPLLPAGVRLDEAAAGWTPLRPAPHLGAALGLDDLWIKDETTNPTGSFKDRVVELAAARAVDQGLKGLACTSTGNLARAVASTAAHLGLRSMLLVPGDISPAVARDLAARGATVVPVEGGYDAASRLGSEAASELVEWGWVNVTLRPWYELGARTVGWEIVEQLVWQLPDRVVAPMASGALVRAVHESMAQLVEVGLVEGVMPKLTAVQPEGCAPVARAFAEGAARIQPVRHPHTVAESLEMGDPPDGQAVLDLARGTGGSVAAVSEERILAAAAMVAETEGIEVEPAGGVVAAALADLVAHGAIDPSERIVAVLTGGLGREAGPGVEPRLVPTGSVADTIKPSMSALAGQLPADLLR